VPGTQGPYFQRRHEHIPELALLSRHLVTLSACFLEVPVTPILNLDIVEARFPNELLELGQRDHGEGVASGEDEGLDRLV
jgi:hypothetical protein